MSPEAAARGWRSHHEAPRLRRRTESPGQSRRRRYCSIRRPFESLTGCSRSLVLARTFTCRAITPSPRNLTRHLMPQIAGRRWPTGNTVRHELLPSESVLPSPRKKPLPFPWIQYGERGRGRRSHRAEQDWADRPDEGPQSTSILHPSLGDPLGASPPTDTRAVLNVLRRGERRNLNHPQ